MNLLSLNFDNFQWILTEQISWNYLEFFVTLPNLFCFLISAGLLEFIHDWGEEIVFLNGDYDSILIEEQILRNLSLRATNITNGRLVEKRDNFFTVGLVDELLDCFLHIWQ